MKIFLLEYITAGGFNKHPLPNTLLQEALLMRDALLRDFGALNGVEIVTTYDARLAKPNVAEVVGIHDNADPLATWRMLLESCDAVLIVAPETDHILSELTHMVMASSACNLGCLLPAVLVASNKFETYKTLKNAGILTVATSSLDTMPASFFEYSHQAYVVKPVDGAGCENTLYFQNQLDLKDWYVTSLSQNINAENLIVQPYIQGQPASISALFNQGKAWVLGCNVQKVTMRTSEDKKITMQYTGSIVNGLFENTVQFERLANKIALTLPDLNGYVGIDVIIQHEQIYVVEINPRITTSYIGLRESIGANPATFIMDLANNKDFTLPNNLSHHPVNIDLYA